MDFRSIEDARKGYIEGAGPPSPGHAILRPSLTLTNARLSLSLLRMCRKASGSSRIGLNRQ